MTGHSTSESENDARKRLGEVFNDIFYERQLDRLTSEEFKAAVEKMRAETPAILIGFCSRCAVDTLARMEWWVEAKKKGHQSRCFGQRAPPRLELRDEALGRLGDTEVDPGRAAGPLGGGRVGVRSENASIDGVG